MALHAQLLRSHKQYWLTGKRQTSGPQTLIMKLAHHGWLCPGRQLEPVIGETAWRLRLLLQHTALLELLRCV